MPDEDKKENQDPSRQERAEVENSDNQENQELNPEEIAAEEASFDFGNDTSNLNCSKCNSGYFPYKNIVGSCFQTEREILLLNNKSAFLKDNREFVGIILIKIVMKVAKNAAAKLTIIAALNAKMGFTVHMIY